jgi:Domain of unknown function (DUF4158)/Tn3 transposase DDE domain
VAARQRLSEAQIAELYDPPTEQRELVRHFTLSDADLAANRRCRGDHNRLGQALMLCYLRYPGRPLRAGERPPAALLAFVAEQIEVFPGAIDEYLAAERNRRCHSAELQDRLRLRPFGPRSAAELTAWLLPRAVEDDRFAHLARLVMEECRQRRIILPTPGMLERLCSDDVPDHLLAHLSPLGWEHVNLTGDYVWGARAKMSENLNGLRPLRAAPELMRKAA